MFAVLGAVIGKQKGRNIEVMNSFELLFDFIEGEIIVNMEYYNTKEEQCTLNLSMDDIIPSKVLLFQHSREKIYFECIIIFLKKYIQKLCNYS